MLVGFSKAGVKQGGDSGADLLPSCCSDGKEPGEAPGGPWMSLRDLEACGHDWGGLA